MKRTRTMKVRTIAIIVILAFLFTGCGNQGKSFYKSAVKEYKKGDYEAAASDFVKAIELKADNADYYIDYGYCLILLERYDEARQTFQKAILDKENSIVNRNNKKAYRGIGIAFYMSGDYKNALTSFTKAMEFDSLNDYNMDIVSYMGNANLMLGNYEDAVQNFSTVLDKEPKNSLALKRRAKSYSLLGKYEESLKDYSAAKEIDRTDFDVYFGLYDAYQGLGKMSEAKAILEEATNLSIEDDEDKFYLAKIHYYQGNFEQAVDGFLASSEQGNVESYLYLGDIYSSQQNIANALYYYELYLKEASSKNAEFYNKLGVCYLDHGDYKKALEMIEAALGFAGSQEQKNLLRNEIIAYEHLGDFASAYTKMESYLAKYPEDEEAVRDMEFLKTRQNQIQEEEDEESEPVDEIVKP